MHGYAYDRGGPPEKREPAYIPAQFFMLVEVDRSGDIVWRLEGLRVNPHDPEELPNGNILVNTRRPQVIREYNKSGEIVWEHFPKDADVIRYNHKPPNGNIIFAERRETGSFIDRRASIP